MLTLEDRDARIREIVCEYLEIDTEDLGDTDRFVEDHGADSLSMIGVLAALETEFRISIEDDQLRRMHDLVRMRAVLAEIAGW